MARLQPFSKCDDAAESLQGLGLGEAVLQEEIGAAALLGVGRLLRQDLLESLFGHAGPGQHALALDLGRRGHHQNGVHTPLGTGFIKQRDVQHHQRRAAAGVTAQEALGLLPHQGVQDRFQAAQGLGLSKDGGAQLLPVDCAVMDHAGKGGLDGGHGPPVLGHQPVDRGVGVVQRQAEPPEHPRDRRFSHADGAGETQDHHAVSPQGRRRAVPP